MWNIMQGGVSLDNTPLSPESTRYDTRLSELRTQTFEKFAAIDGRFDSLENTLKTIIHLLDPSARQALDCSEVQKKSNSSEGYATPPDEEVSLSDGTQFKFNSIVLGIH
jgi:hypothetical protein